MLPDTISSLTARPGIAKIAAASGEPFASSAPANRRTPPLSTGTLSTNLQRWLSIGSAVIRISAVLSGGGTVLPHGFRRGDHVFERGERLLPAARLETAVGVHPDLRVIQHARHALQRARDFGHGRHPWGVDVVHTGTDLVRVFVLLEALQQLRAGAGVLDRDHVRVHARSEEHTSELQSPYDLVCRLLL